MMFKALLLQSGYGLSDPKLEKQLARDLSLAPTAENATLINDIFFPMITQLYGGGSSPG